jgi:hypothetical protein
MIISESMNYKVSSEYSVDLALRTPGYFIVKDFKDKVVARLSATILDSKTFCRSLGLAYDEVKFIQVDSDFPLQNRPIYPLNIAYQIFHQELGIEVSALASSYARNPIPIQPIFMSIIFHHYKQLLKLSQIGVGSRHRFIT